MNVFAEGKRVAVEKKFNLGALLKDHVPKPSIGAAVKLVKAWSKENGVELSFENQDKIIAFIVCSPHTF